MRTRIYATSADRQRAYRARHAQGPTPAVSPPPRKPARPPSRPARLAAARDALTSLQEEYESWLEGLPESLTGGSQAERLQEAIEQLQAVADLLDEIQLPRGYGHD